MEIFIGWLILSLLVAWLATSRGRSGVGFFLISAVLSPLIGLIAVLVTKDLNAEEIKRVQQAIQQDRDHERQLESIKVLAAPLAAAQHQAPPPATVTSVADEIGKLAVLQEKGLITAEEFNVQKAKLLGRSS